jgi:type IV pilus assembly protein PilN
VTAIEPQITADGDVIIRLRVSGDRDRAVQLVRNLERSSRFIAPRLSAEATQTKEQTAAAAASGAAPGGVEFDILANYNPLPPTATDARSDVKAREGAPRSAKPRVKAAPRRGPGDGVVLKPFSPARSPNAGGAR